ncbi:MAG: endo alpha-1,4 polygalactosaminidase [Chloroflexi bacterium]|nr:endo alpha-1,4 polygalactosaminidase [Chloroflexota bacterium]MBU1662274.1 endo alpha-1,4 polygalactosaminidase [Chloroflexota bacterium]
MNKISNIFMFFGCAALMMICAACSHATADMQSESSAPGSTENVYLPAISASEGMLDWWQPAPGTSWQWQLSGDIDTSFDVQMYDIDLFDTPQNVIDQLHADGRIVICYLSAGSWEEWRDDAGQFPAPVIGEPLEGWEGEYWLDIRQLDVLGPLMGARLDAAVQKNCDGVEPDNVNAYEDGNDAGFPLTYQDQIVYNIWLAEQAHARGLSIGLKNDLEQIDDLLPYFDWALNESCFYYDECDALLPFVQTGKAVFGVEYELSPDDFCSQANAMNFDWLKKNWDLDAWREACR